MGLTCSAANFLRSANSFEAVAYDAFLSSSSKAMAVTGVAICVWIQGQP